MGIFTCKTTLTFIYIKDVLKSYGSFTQFYICHFFSHFLFLSFFFSILFTISVIFLSLPFNYGKIRFH